jgi:hypothetical protein
MSVQSETFPAPGRSSAGPHDPDAYRVGSIDPTLIEATLDGAPAPVTNVADLGLRRTLLEEQEKRKAGRESNRRTVEEIRSLIAVGKRDLAKLRAARSAAISELLALYGQDSNPTQELFRDVQVTPGATGAGVGTSVQLARREHDRQADACENLKGDLVHWARCLAETEERLESGVFDRPSPREEQLQTAVAVWEQRLKATRDLYEAKTGREPRRRRFLG